MKTTRKQQRYSKIKARYRQQEKRSVLKVALCTSENDSHIIDKQLRNAHLAENELRVFIRKRLEQARKTRKWRRARKAYHAAVEHQKKVKHGGRTWNECEETRKAAAAQVEEVLEQYGVTKDELDKKAKELAKKFGVMAVIARTMANDVWRAVEANIYRGGKDIHVKKREDDNTVRAKQYDRCIMLKNDNRAPDVDGVKRVHPYVSFCGAKMPLDIQDAYQMEMIEAICKWMEDPEVTEKHDVRNWLKTGKVRDSHRPCFVTIEAERKKNKTIYWALITYAGSPVEKKDALGLPRHERGEGRVGDDIGVVSNHYVARNQETGVLELHGDNTAVTDEGAQEENERKMKRNQRAIDRSIRAMNPSAFNADGTRIPGKKSRRRSKRCRKLQAENRQLHRKNAIMRANAVNRLANEARSHGNLLVIEDNSASAWAKKAAPAKNADGSLDKTSNKKRKRLGKSVAHGCPGAQQEALKDKFGEGNIIVVSRKFRASQYNPVTDEYVKHELGVRSWRLVEDDPKTEVLRDGFSAFCLYCSDEDGAKPDRDKMLALLGEYFSAQDAYITRQRSSGHIVRNSGVVP